MAFHGKVALVTGAASGMGRISARRLAEMGAEVAALDLNESGLEETAEGHGSIHGYVCDVSNEGGVAHVVGLVESELGPIDRVTHAAAIMPASPLAAMPTGEVLRLMRVNYDGTVNVTLATLPSMLERRSGDLILYGSLAGHVLTPHLGAYCATKAAINAFAEVLIRENEGSGLRFLLVCPPMVDTPLLEQAKQSSNPRSVQLGLEQGRAADPNFVVDSIEEALEKGQRILFPGREAKVLFALRRFAPSLLWKIILKAESS
ncbi:MAG: SDR family NAD(P)-dependent oxidoreductase [Candidatus Binatia bacterium]